MVLKSIIPVIIVGKICVYILQNGQELLSALSNDWGNLTKDVRKLIWASKIVIKSTLNVELQLHKRVWSNSAASRLVMCLLLVLKNEDWNEFNLLVVWFSISYWGRKKRKLNACQIKYSICQLFHKIVYQVFIGINAICINTTSF